jgi:hypothetical protein
MLEFRPKPHLIFALLAIIATPVSVAQSTSCFGHAPWVGATLDGAPCIGNAQEYGPLDYNRRAKYPSNLAPVENAQFPCHVENLMSGNSESVMADIDYTLRAGPNHHRAVNLVIRYRLRQKSTRWISEFPPAECHPHRAIIS